MTGPVFRTMATPTPWQVAAYKKPTVKRTPVYAYDPYNFSLVTTSNGTNPPVTIPATGPNAAGAVFPTSARTVINVLVEVVGTNAVVEYGNNLAGPSV